MFPRRGGGGPDRYTGIRIGLIFMAAGIWIGGVVTGRDEVTAVAIVILVVALILQIIGRRQRD